MPTCSWDPDCVGRGAVRIYYRRFYFSRPRGTSLSGTGAELWIGAGCISEVRGQKCTSDNETSRCKGPVGSSGAAGVTDRGQGGSGGEREGGYPKRGEWGMLRRWALWS